MENTRSASAGGNVAENTRRLRKRQGLSLAELSSRLAEGGHPLSLKVLSKIENGDRSIDVDDLAALAVALGTSTTRLLMSPGVAASERISQLIEAWRGLIDERQKALEMNATAISRIEELIRSEAAADEDARALVEGHGASANPSDEISELLARVLTGGDANGER